MAVWNAHRFGLGPVFVYEWLTSSRRWQQYALRSLFITILLVALTLVWSGRANSGTIRGSASLGQSFFVTIVCTQLALVLLAAPGSTAGAICLDRSRGTLTHLMVTDLSAAEIVLGKLAARLVPVITMILCTFPLLTLLSLLGGVDPDGLIGALMVTLGVAVFGSTLALLFSLWARRTHEALLATYAVFAVWLLCPLMAWALAGTLGISVLDPLKNAHPFYLALAPNLAPGSVRWSNYEWYLLASLAISAVLAFVAVTRLRAVCSRDQSQRRPLFRLKRGQSRTQAKVGSRPGWRLAGPSLDFNPVLWREWHRNRPSGWSRAIAVLYAVLAIVFTGAGMISGSQDLGHGVNALQVSTGLLLLSVIASTSLAEERTRGSLDVLMTTTLSTREIVLGKWLGTFRYVPLLAVLPTLLLFWRAGWHVAKWRAPILMAAYVLAAGAAVSALGVAVATWCRRLGRAVGITVAAYVIVAVGWMFFVMSITSPHPYGFPAIAASPVFAPVVIGSLPTAGASERMDLPGVILWIAVYTGVTVALLGAALATFDRCLGRVRANEGPITPRNGGSGAGSSEAAADRFTRPQSTEHTAEPSTAASAL